MCLLFAAGTGYFRLTIIGFYGLDCFCNHGYCNCGCKNIKTLCILQDEYVKSTATEIWRQYVLVSRKSIFQHNIPAFGNGNAREAGFRDRNIDLLTEDVICTAGARLLLQIKDKTLIPCSIDHIYVLVRSTC